MTAAGTGLGCLKQAQSREFIRCSLYLVDKYSFTITLRSILVLVSKVRCASGSLFRQPETTVSQGFNFFSPRQRPGCPAKEKKHFVSRPATFPCTPCDATCR